MVRVVSRRFPVPARLSNPAPSTRGNLPCHPLRRHLLAPYFATCSPLCRQGFASLLRTLDGGGFVASWRCEVAPGGMTETGAVFQQQGEEGREMSTSRRRLSCIRRLLGIQGGKCFYCGQSITEQDASIDHLVPKGAGGGRGENLVVCCRPINHFFGHASLKLKLTLMADPDFIRSLSRWCLPVDRGY